MPGILDIAPPEISTETFEIRGGSIEVRGLRNREWAALLRRFPELRQQQIAAAEDLSPEMVDRMEAVMPAVIAAAAGTCGDENIEAAIADRLTESEQVAVFSAVMRLTMPPAPLAGSPVAAGQEGGEQAATATPRASSN